MDLAGAIAIYDGPWGLTAWSEIRCFAAAKS